LLAAVGQSFLWKSTEEDEEYLNESLHGLRPDDDMDNATVDGAHPLGHPEIRFWMGKKFFCWFFVPILI